MQHNHRLVRIDVFTVLGNNTPENLETSMQMCLFFCDISTFIIITIITSGQHKNLNHFL